MTTPLDTIKAAILGNPLDPNKKPSRQGVIKAFAEMQAQLEASASGAIVRATRAALPSTAPSAGAMAWVTNDEVIGYNGVYENTGTAIAAVWQRRIDIPQFVITAMNLGAGMSENEIVATSDLPVPAQDGRTLIILNIVAENTADGPTVSINGGTPLTITSISDRPIPAGGLEAGMAVAGYVTGTKFKLLSDYNVGSAVEFQADRAFDEAERSKSERIDAETARDQSEYWSQQSNAFAGESQSSAADAQALVEAANAGFGGFAADTAYDFGYVTDPVTYFNQDFGGLT